MGVKQGGIAPPAAALRLRVRQCGATAEAAPERRFWPLGVRTPSRAQAQAGRLGLAPVVRRRHGHLDDGSIFIPRPRISLMSTWKETGVRASSVFVPLTMDS